MPSSPPLSVAFHIGAHKTATTHLQRSLLRASDALTAQGVRYYGPDYFRLPGRTIPALFGTGATGAAADSPRRSPREQLALMAKDGHRVVLSEENFIGPLNQPHGKAMNHRYKPAGDRLAALSAAIGRDIDVHLAIRRPTSFINSAYCQMLLGGRIQSVETFQRRNPLASVDWLELVQRLRATAGVGQVTVWRYEDYAQVFPQVVAGLVGADAAACVKPRPRHINKGLSVPAVAYVLAQAEADTAAGVARAARKMLPVEDGHPPFDGFAEEQHAIGDAAYARQVRAIAAMDRVTLLLRAPE